LYPADKVAEFRGRALSQRLRVGWRLVKEIIRK
jgi:hypothetical protein